jgi:hypothetical protein
MTHRIRACFRRSRSLALPGLLAAPVLLAAAAAGTAQEGAITGAITYDRATRLAMELPEQVRERIGDEIPGESFDAFLLLFSPEQTVMIPADAPEEETAEDGDAAGGGGGSAAGRDRRISGFVSRMQRFSPERSDQERVLVAHTDLGSGTVVENRTFMGRTFLIEGERPAIAWRLTGEQSQFAGYLVVRALASVDDQEVEAWFTPQIPVPGGPAGYGGLPGMILSLSIDGGRIVYSATGVRLTPVDAGAIRPPTRGEAVTRDEYEVLVAERLEELRMMREQQERRRRGGGQ